MSSVRLPAVRASLAVCLLVRWSLAAVVVPEGEVGGALQQGAPSWDCPSCSAARSRRNSSAGGQSDMVEAVKRHILNMLHLSARPNLTQPLPPRAALLNAIRKLQVGRVGRDGSVEMEDEGRDSGPAPAPEPPSEVITFAEPGDSPDTMSFDLSKEGRSGAVVEQADVWIFLKLLKGGRGKGKAQLRLQPAPGAEPLAQKTVEARRSGWHALAVPRGVQALLDGGGGRLSLAVSCPLCAQAGAAPLLPPERSHRPFLMVTLQAPADAGRRRARRGLECDGKTGLCCKREFYVNFKDIGWSDWIIAPSGYHANYCEGECPAHMASAGNSPLSFHSTVISHYRLRGYSPFQNLRSCCVPTRLRAMSMLYYNEEQKIIKKDIQNMMVDECGCS